MFNNNEIGKHHLKGSMKILLEHEATDPIKTFTQRLFQNKNHFC